MRSCRARLLVQGFGPPSRRHAVSNQSSSGTRRTSADVRGLAQILARLDEAKVSFRSATEPFDTSSSAGRMMVQLLGVFAEFERSSIVERTIARMERKAARGEWTGGSVPYGYELDDDRRFLVPEPNEAPVIAQI